MGCEPGFVFWNTLPPEPQMWFFPVPKGKASLCQAETAFWGQTCKGTVAESFISDRSEAGEGCLSSVTVGRVGPCPLLETPELSKLVHGEIQAVPGLRESTVCSSPREARASPCACLGIWP